jgi:2-oxoisovalerate dehydrogenase E1 component
MIPIAAGLAFSNILSKNKNISIAFLGDGTLGEGIVYETLNISALWKIPIVYILEKNNISQSTSFRQNFSGNIEDRVRGFGINYFKTSIYDLSDLDDKIKNAFTYSRNERKPVFIEIELGRLNSHSKGDDNRSLNEIQKLKQIDPLNNFLLKNSEFIYEWECEIDKIIENSLKILNVVQTINLEKKKEVVKDFHEFSLVNINSINEVRFNELIYNELDKLLMNEEGSILIGEDIENNNEFTPNEYGGAFKVTRDLSIKYPERVKNTPISEQAIVGIAIGSALKDRVSIVEIMFGDFLTLTLDQLLQHASKFTMMYGKKFNLPFILRTPMGGFRGYGPTHSQSLEKHFLGIPGLRVIVLNQLISPAEIFKIILEKREPVLLIENKSLYTKKLYEGVLNGYSLYLSSLEDSYPVVKLKPQYGISDITIVCYGGIVDEVLKAIEGLFINEEILADVFVVSEITNSFIPGLEDSLSITKKLCFIEEGSSFAAFSSEITTTLLENKCNNFTLLRISNNSIIPSSRELEQLVLPTSNKIRESLINFIK